MKKLLISALSMGVFLAACQKGNKEHVAPQTSGHAVVVQEVIQANAYTYLNVAENGQTFWIAITKADIKEGQKLYYDSGLEMTNFESTKDEVAQLCQATGTVYHTPTSDSLLQEGINMMDLIKCTFRSSINLSSIAVYQYTQQN